WRRAAKTNAARGAAQGRRCGTSQSLVRSTLQHGHVARATAEVRFIQESAMTVRRTHKGGFTLVEILIVVIILGILAAIVIPQFTSASQDARKNSLTSQLQTIRSQLELYKLQHLDKLPSTLVGSSPDWSQFIQKS